ncbi:MAG: hypothetical protein V2I97_00240 [Desulfococcaceae bacterium]|jgi:hypothetical protein|nr:hypothetical protein [Desulfococcaceae bacterium]
MSRGRKIGNALLFFGILCLISAGFLAFPDGDTVMKSLPPDAPLFGPLEVGEDRSVYKIGIRQSVPYGHWSHISGEVLDKNKKPLFGFGDELWAETGYDSEGRWSEKKDAYDYKILLDKGTYYLDFSLECSNPPCKSFLMTVEKKRGSAVPFIIPGIIFILLGILIHMFASRKS